MEARLQVVCLSEWRRRDCDLRSVLLRDNAMRTPASLTGRKVQNVSSRRTTRPIDSHRESVRFGLKMTVQRG
jgi:hypothetical protein